MTDVLPAAPISGRPPVPTDRERELGRVAEEVDFSAEPTLPADATAAEVARPSLLGRFVAFVKNLDPRLVDGPMAPLVAISLLSTISTFYFDAFGIALPSIQTDLGIDLVALGAISSVAQLTVLVRPLAGFLADRINRVRMLRTGALVSTAGYAAIGLSGGLPMLAVGGLLQSGGEVIGQPAGFTLITDYYPVRTRLRAVFFLFQVGGLLSLVAGPVAGLVTESFGWQAVFFLLSILSGIGLIILSRMREVPRGYWERIAMGADDETARRQPAPISWAESWRTAWSISFLRRQYVAAPFLAILSYFQLNFTGLYYAQEYGVTPGGAGLILAVNHAAAFIGLVVIAPLLNRLVTERPRAVVVLQAAQGLASASIFGLVLLVHTLPLAIAIFALGSMIASTIFPLQFGLTSLVLPARMRAFGYQSVLFAAFPATILTGVGGAAVIQTQGLGAVVAYAAIASCFAAIILLSGVPFVERDIRNALIASMATEEARQRSEAGANAMLLCRGVDVAYNGVQVLFGVDFDAREGEIVAILGTNGAGKSTLLRAIAGVREPVGGAIFLDGRDITHTPPHENAAAGAVVVPGGQAVCPTLSVAENLRTAAWLRRKDSDYVEGRLAEALEIFPKLRERMGQQAGTLSGGEQQMVALAQSYLMEPRLLMIDELSLGLAPQVVESLLESLRRINAAGTTILLVEQSLNVALTIASRAVFMDKGEIRFDGSTSDLLARPDLVRAVFMGGQASGGRRRSRPKAAEAPGEQLLQVTDVSVAFGGLQALGGVTLEVAPREIVGIIGPNGAGKTTLFDVVSGLVLPSTGSVTLKGEDVSSMGLDARAKRGLGRSFQSARLFPSLTVRENITVAMQQRLSVRNPLFAALWAPPLRASERKAAERVGDVIELLGLTAFADKFVGELSTGSRRAVDVGCIMVSSPDLLLLDEPSSGLAQAETEGLGPVIQRIVRETGCGVAIIEHDLPLITSVSDRLVAMELGRVIASGPPEQVTTDPQVQRAYLSASKDVLLRSNSAFAGALLAAGMVEDPVAATAGGRPSGPDERE